MPSRGVHAVERAVDWTAERQPDLVVITGDLLTHPSGEPRLRALVERLASADVRGARQPRRRDRRATRRHGASNLRDLEPATLLRDEGVLLELRGRRVWIAGAHPRLIVRRLAKVDPNSLSRDADLRILLCHFPRVFDRLEPGRFDLVLAGHMHDGQISHSVSGREAPARASDAPATATASTAARAARDARLARPRDDVRAVPLRRAARGDRAGATFADR